MVLVAPRSSQQQPRTAAPQEVQASYEIAGDTLLKNMCYCLGELDGFSDTFSFSAKGTLYLLFGDTAMDMTDVLEAHGDATVTDAFAGCDDIGLLLPPADDKVQLKLQSATGASLPSLSVLGGCHISDVLSALEHRFQDAALARSDLCAPGKIAGSFIRLKLEGLDESMSVLEAFASKVSKMPVMFRPQLPASVADMHIQLPAGAAQLMESPPGGFLNIT